VARIVNKEEYELRRNEILDAAQRLVYTKGYEQMAIQDILTELKISKGAFYHYFDSKQALLEALIERLAAQITPILGPIVQDAHLGAAEKMQRVFDSAARWKTARKEYLLMLVNVWYADENALLRQKVQAAVIPQIAPMITTVICQGVQEGVFHTSFPEQISEIIFPLMLGFGETMVKLIVQPEYHPETFQRLETLAATYQDAVERILGAEAGSLPLFDVTVLREWLPPPKDPT